MLVHESPLHLVADGYCELTDARCVRVARPVKMLDTIYSMGNLRFCSGQMRGQQCGGKGLPNRRDTRHNLARTLVEFRTMRVLKFTENGESNE